MHGLRGFRNIVCVWDAGRGVTAQIVEPVSVSLDEESAPSLFEGDRGGRSVRAAHDLRQRLPDRDIFEIERFCAAALFLGIDPGNLVQLLRGVGRRQLEFLVFAFLPGRAALDAHAPRLGLRQFMAVASRKTDQRDLLEHASGEAARQLHQVLERHLRIDALAQAYRFMPTPMRSGEERVYAGQPSAIADRYSAEGVKLAWRGDQAAIARCARVGLIEVQGIAVSGGLGPMADRVARDLGQVGRLVDGNLLSDLGANSFQFRVGGEAVFC